MGPEALAQVLQPLAGLVPKERAAFLIAGLDEGDDAAVYRLDDEKCLIFTTDFFTPIVDDPYDFGAIAAANALSDVYATGGEPVIALNIAAFPAELPVEVIAEIVRGGAEKASEAGCAVVGGHTIMDKEPKFGMAVIGFAHPDRVLLKSGARAGDILILTKALGTGAITTAAKAGACPPEALVGAVDSMKRLNRDALRVLAGHHARACTDVTGFSFAGHALELADKSGVGLRIFAKALPYLDSAAALAAAGYLPGGAKRNRQFYASHIDFDAGLDEAFRALFFVPETSGGLLAAIPGEEAETCLAALLSAGLSAAIVGIVTERGQGSTMVVIDPSGSINA
ncbi:MAG: selenide, water dikinase SelD [Spirochaetes bacterium GWB1_59_5]|nr:MAG: selenide, water dikinase SelD [Spirochaetes bacterium GWB1_59_5]